MFAAVMVVCGVGVVVAVAVAGCRQYQNSSWASLVGGGALGLLVYACVSYSQRILGRRYFFCAANLR